MTLTLDNKHKRYIQSIAKKFFEGNESMAMRKIIGEHIDDRRNRGYDVCLVCGYYNAQIANVTRNQNEKQAKGKIYYQEHKEIMKANAKRSKIKRLQKVKR